MSVCVEEEQRSESAGSSCLSLKSDRSKGELLNFSNEPGPSDTKIQSLPAVDTGSADSASAHTGTSLLHQETPPVPSVEKDPEPRAGLQTASQTSSVQTDVGLQEVLDEHKISLRRRCKRVTEGSDEAGSETLLNRIYTELYITEGQSEEVNTQHETKRKKKQKYDKRNETSSRKLTRADRKLLLKLGRLAFEQLEKGNIMFYQEDLEQCGLDVTEASVYSGVCTEIFKRECVIFQKTVYCFVHLSIQEFLAAVYMFHCYTNSNTEVLETFLKEYEHRDSNTKSFLKNISARFGNSGSLGPSLDIFLRKAMEKSP
ncbi:hypothetical protein L3Q82_004723 [Scortum barcoo]|uniref:Uncharacterized protein n=1 Tax=Scortum barcoo TaxID=214431 RepID=A0ACB8VHN4_9TELE|nr:hypothetical protein L3Q82_004723 [Scortum barcoo]